MRASDVYNNEAQAKAKIKTTFGEQGCDYFRAAKALGVHHQTLRKWVRYLGISEQLIRARARAIASGARESYMGAPVKEPPSEQKIITAYKRNGFTREGAAQALGVSEPTLRRWVRDLKLTNKLKKAG